MLRTLEDVKSAPPSPGLFQLGEVLRPADVSHTQVLVVNIGEANVHQDLAQAVVHGVQDEALCERVVSRCGSSGLQQLSGAAASEARDGRVCRSGRSGRSGCEQLSRGAEERQVFKGGAAEAEGGVVVLQGDHGTARRADGAEVQSALDPFTQGRHLPGLGQYIGEGLAGCGGAQVAATFYGGLEGELMIGAVLPVWLSISLVLESRSI